MLLNWQKLFHRLIGFILLELLCYIFGGAICLVKKEGGGLQTFPGGLEFLDFLKTHPRCNGCLPKTNPEFSLMQSVLNQKFGFFPFLQPTNS